MSAATVDVLGASELLHVLSFLPASACATMACVQRSWRDLAKEDFAWKKYLLEDFGVGALLSPEGEGGMAPATYREAYDGWRARYGRYGGMYPRARACWGRIESFLEAEFPEARESLRPGAPEAALAEAEAELGLAIPLCLRVLYGIHDGQELLFDTNLDNNRQMLDASMFWGLFGGYIFYNHAVCTRMLSLARMVRWNASLRQRGILNAHPSFLLFAASYNFQKMHFVDVDTGLVHVMRQRFRAPLQCVPTGALVAAPGGGAVGDGALRWMEEFSSRVEGGVLRVEPLDPDNEATRGISLFEREGPRNSVAVTRGIRVESSALMVPENSRPGENMFTYSIRLSMPPELQAADSLPTSQLLTRHWNIYDGEGHLVDEVRGEGVIGKYPECTVGMPLFVYQSCTTQEEPLGFMDGELGFVEGTQESPTGPEFDVAVGRFRLEVPEYIF